MLIHVSTCCFACLYQFEIDLKDSDGGYDRQVGNKVTYPWGFLRAVGDTATKYSPSSVLSGTTLSTIDVME